MGKASTRRKKKRQEHLKRLVRKNPGKFRSEWAKRIESWTKEAERRAVRLKDDNGIPVPSAFTLVDIALNELTRCGEEAVSVEYKETKEVMTDSCCRAVSKAVDYRMYRLSNSRSNQWAMETGTHKPPG